MKKTSYIILLFFSLVSFSQKKVLKKFQSQAKSIAIFTSGLDHLVIENTSSNFIEVILEAESYDDQLIQIAQLADEATIKFHFEGTETREVIFRKFITKRLQRANAIVKLPFDKKVTIYGENVDITSVNIANILSIYIDNGIVKLNTVGNNTLVKLYAGNVFGKVKLPKIDVISSMGKIQVDEVNYTKNYQKKGAKASAGLSISTIKGNIFLTTAQNKSAEK